MAPKTDVCSLKAVLLLYHDNVKCATTRTYTWKTRAVLLSESAGLTGCKQDEINVRCACDQERTNVSALKDGIVHEVQRLRNRFSIQSGITFTAYEFTLTHLAELRALT